MADKSLGAQILELIPENLREDLISEIKASLIEKGEVVEPPKKVLLTAEQKKEIINNAVDRVMM
jgi:hypothetical protein